MEKLIPIIMLCFLAMAMAKVYGEVEGAEDLVKWYEQLGQAKLKVTTLHFYVQDLVSGENATVWRVAQADKTPTSHTGFGLLSVLDNAITIGPEPDSGQLGRIQGTIALSDLKEQALQMDVTVVFTAGEYNGSTLSIVGRNPLWAKTREIPVIGGTGVFRMARGSVKVKTYFTIPSVYGVLEYFTVVAHYEVDGQRSSI